MSKPFSQALYDRDDHAKEFVIDWLWERHGIRALVNPDKYGVDLVTDKYEIEVEVKHNWKGEKFPYQSIHFSARKLKFVKPTTVFFMLNDDWSYGLLVEWDAMEKAKTIRKDTIYTEQEKFLEVALSDCQFVKMS